MDPVVLEVLEEARWMKKLEVDVPKAVMKISRREASVRALHSR